MSSQGDSCDSGAPRSARPMRSMPTMVCIHVVPHFDGVEMTTSPERRANRSHREESPVAPDQASLA
jgi:hypothetical protein